MKFLIRPTLLARALTAALLLTLSSIPSRPASAQSPYFPSTQPTYNPYRIGRHGIASYGVDRFTNNPARRGNIPHGLRSPPPALARQLDRSPTANASRGIRDFPIGEGYNQSWSNSNVSPYGYGR